MPPVMRQDLVEVLSEQHTRIRDLLESVTTAQGPERRQRLEELHRQVQIQFIIEENLLHPMQREHVRGLQAEVLVAESHMRHGLVDRSFAALYSQTPDTAEFGYKLAVLQEALERHMDDQRDEVFPALRACCTKETLVELARPIVLKRRALEQSRRGAAHSPAW